MVTYGADPSILPPLLNKARSLVQAGYEVETLCHTERRDLPRREDYAGGFEVVRVYSRARRFFAWAWGLSPRSALTATIQYALTYAEYNFIVVAAALRSNADLFEAHDLPTLPPTLLASWILRRPILYHAHEIHAEAQRSVRFARFWKLLERSLVPFVDTVVTPEENRSRIMKEEAAARRLPFTVMNCPPYRPPLRTDRLREVLAQRGLAPRFIVLYQGLFHEDRCTEELIASTRHFAEGTMLVLMGSGYGDYADLRPLVADSPRVAVLPSVPYDELHHYTASADVGVLLYRNTCRNNYYCAPNKVHEYMMMGLPVIANDFPGMKSLVEGERVGFTVDCENPLQIAEAANLLARDEDVYRTYRGNALRASRERYNWEREFAKLEPEYKRLLDPPGEREPPGSSGLA